VIHHCGKLFENISLHKKVMYWTIISGLTQGHTH